MDATNLESMKRTELQKLAKKAGIKANKKTDHLISELKKYYSNNNGSDALSQQSDQDTCSSQTESFTTTASEHETTTESETEVKPKVTRGRRGKKLTKKTKKASPDQDTDASEVEETETTPIMAENQLSEDKADTPPKRVTKARKGRRGRKRAATSSPVKDATPAKLTKHESETIAEVVKTTPQIETASVPTTSGSSNRRAANKKSETPKPEETVAIVKTPQNEKVTVTTTRGSSSRRAANQTVATPEVQNPTPTVTKTATPVITDTKPATRGSSGKRASKRRRSTFEIVPATKTQTPQPGSPPKKEVKSDPKMKAAIMAEIEKKAAEEQAKQPTTRIPKPRFRQSNNKPTTPGNKNWAKIHAAKMSKVESIDDYLERKRKRTENMCASVKRAKIVAEEAKAAIETLKAHRTPPVKGMKGAKIVKPVFNKPKVNMMSPHPASKAAIKGVKPRATPRFTSPLIIKSTTKPTPTAPTTGTKSVSFKVSKLKTPKPALALAAGKTLCQKRISTPGPTSASRKSMGDAAEKRKSLMASGRKSIGDAANQHKSVGAGITPFKFGDTRSTAITPATVKKPVFDIKASLSKGLTYKPHTGKLKPLVEKNYQFSATKTHPTSVATKTNPTSVSKAKVQLKMHNNVVKAKAELKKPKITSREERRAGVNKRRVGKRGNNMMARRGIQMEN